MPLTGFALKLTQETTPIRMKTSGAVTDTAIIRVRTVGCIVAWVETRLVHGSTYLEVPRKFHLWNNQINFPQITFLKLLSRLFSSFFYLGVVPSRKGRRTCWGRVYRLQYRRVHRGEDKIQFFHMG